MASPARTPQVDRRRPLLEVAIVAVGLTFWTAALARPLGDA
jgi:hypothetical protein